MKVSIDPVIQSRTRYYSSRNSGHVTIIIIIIIIIILNSRKAGLVYSALNSFYCSAASEGNWTD
jgi:hypothetical protein